MKATGKIFAGLALAAGLAAHGAMASEAGKNETAAAARPAGWERVGEVDATRAAPEPARNPAAVEEGMKARKAEMVRRMFWIMLAHR